MPVTDSGQIWPRCSNARPKAYDIMRAPPRRLSKLRIMPAPAPQIGDDIAHWLPNRAVRVLHAAGIRTLADLTVRIPAVVSGGVPFRGSAGQCKADRGILCRASSTHGAGPRTDRRRSAVSRDAWDNSGYRMRSTDPPAPSAHRCRPASWASTTITTLSRHGSRCTNPRPRSAPTARKPNG
jgi:hypothetical protein